MHSSIQDCTHSRALRNAARRLALLLAAAAPLALAGCATPRANVPSGQAAYDLIPPVTQEVTLREHLIRPPDKISVLVYREPDLSISDIEVDSAGKVSLPLIGRIDAAGLTTDALASTIEQKLSSQFVRDPKVSVYVSAAASQRIVVYGSVAHPGVFDLRGQMTLLGALATAGGPNQIAALDEVAIFRRTGTQLTAAKFNVEDIRLGRAPDPEILPNDTIVVGFSGIKSAYRDLLQALPLIGIFRPLYN